MQERKTIAIVFGHIINEINGDLFAGIVSQAKALGYNAAVFSLFSLNDELHPHQMGEENIYRLINFDKIAGVIYCDNSIWAAEMRKRITALLEEDAKGRVVCVNSNEPHNFANVIVDERKLFANVVDHVIEVHCKKKIYCLTGPEQFDISQRRLDGYKDSMKAHGLNFDDSFIFYGDFWENAAKVIAADVVSGKIEKPEAFVCANDTMAVSLCNSLIELGVNVPGEIIVVGYDFISESYENQPALTSFEISNRNIGEKCVLELHNIIMGKEPEGLCCDVGSIIHGESCGCGKDINIIKKLGKAARIRHEREEFILSSEMIERLTASESVEMCLHRVCENMYLINDIAQFALCLDEKWDLFSEDDTEYSGSGYSDIVNMRVYYKSVMNSKVCNEPFSSKDMFPEHMLRDDRPVCCYFTPLHFGDRCFGYTVVEYNSDNVTHEKTFRTWIKNINASLEYIRVKERLNVINNRLFIGSIRDSLTGIYNRRGYEKYSDEIFNAAKEEHKKVLLVAVDMDNLKYINDTFGHAEGDNALTVIAQSLQSCSGNSEKCARVGGDEFVIIGCYDYVDETPEFYRRRIQGYLSRYNDMSKKQYLVEASIGCFCDYPDSYDNIDTCYKIADKLMYENKVSRRKNRQN